MVSDPHAVAARWPEPRMRALAALTVAVTQTPWALTADDRVALAAVDLDDDAVIHAVALSAYFGHLNRIADATGVPLDYAVRALPPATEPAVPALAPAPVTRSLDGALTLARRPATAAALAVWVDELMARDRPLLSRAARGEVQALVRGWLGAAPAIAGALDPAIAALAELVTLAPWQLGDQAFAPLRARGWDDAALFDLCAVTSTATVVARIDVALGALSA